MSQTLLAATLSQVARTIGDQLPAAFSTDPGEVQVGGDVTDHPQPEGARTARWTIGSGDGFLAISLTPDAADMLQAEHPDTSLLELLHRMVQSVSGQLAPLFEGTPPLLDGAEEVDAATALADGPGDVVTVALDDAGTHRATLGLRMVVPDRLMDTAGAEDLAGADGAATEPVVEPAPQGAAPQPAQGQAAGAAGVPAQGQAGAPGAGVPLEGPEGVVGAGPVALSADEPPRVAGAPMPIGGPGGMAGMAGGPGGMTGDQARRRQMAAPQMPVGEAHPADFASFDQLASLPGQAHHMSLLGDVEMGVTAELGRTELTVRDVLNLTPGSIIELDRAAGSPVDVVVNGTLIARGEVVVIDEEFGIRITEILGMTPEANPFPVAQ